MTHRSSRAAAVIAAVIAVTTLVGCSADRAESGTKVFSRSVIEGARGTVELPTGSLDLVVTEPRDELTDRQAEPARAPDGGSFVGLSWDFSTAERSATSPYVSRRQPRAATVTLISDGKRYLVGKPYDSSHQVGDDTRSSSWWVAVDGDAEDLKVEVAFDRVRQVFDVANGTTLPGLAAPLYATPSPAPVASSCGTVEPSGRFPRPEYDSFTCDVAVIGTTPWVDEIGWAEPGSTWAILRVSTALLGPFGWDDGTATVQYDSIVPEVWSVAADGEPASVIIDHTDGDEGRGTAVLAVGVPEEGRAELVLRTTYLGDKVAPDAPDVPHPESLGLAFTRKVALTTGG